jgi:hypothetical protein
MRSSTRTPAGRPSAPLSLNRKEDQGAFSCSVRLRRVARMFGRSVATILTHSLKEPAGRIRFAVTLSALLTHNETVTSIFRLAGLLGGLAAGKKDECDHEDRGENKSFHNVVSCIVSFFHSNKQRRQPSLWA